MKNDHIRHKIDPHHRKPQQVLRLLGPVILAAGILLILTGIISFFSAFGGSGSAKYFWCAFLGIPLTFVGGVMTSYGYMGRVARYIAEENAPVIKDTFNYMADGTKDGVRTLASSIGQGLGSGIAAAGLDRSDQNESPQVRCHKCNTLNDQNARFCDNCGTPLTKSRSCPRCDELNDPDARFCDNCGHGFE